MCEKYNLKPDYHLSNQTDDIGKSSSYIVLYPRKHLLIFQRVS